MHIDTLAPLFNMLPTPILVTKDVEDSLNHPIVFINKPFENLIGWTLDDIPFKTHWWEKAYPDHDYQNVVARQWELEVASAKELGENFVSMQVNITTKANGIKRFNVYTQFDFTLIPEHYVVVFEPLDLGI